MTLQNFFKSTNANGVSWGIIGALSYIVANEFTTNGPLKFFLYVPILIAALLTIKFFDKMNFTYRKLFITGLIAFMIMNLIIYFNVNLVENPQSGIMFFGHVWRLLFMLVIGTISSFVISLFVKKLA